MARLHEDGSVKPRRCPKCCALPVSYRERWEGHAIIFEADQLGRWTERVEQTERGARAVAVFARCACGHEWKLRGVRQITDLQQSTEPTGPTKAVSVSQPYVPGRGG